MALLHTEELGPKELCVAPDTTTTLSPSGGSSTPERPAVSTRDPSPLGPNPVQQEREEEEGLNEFQKNMKIEHRQVLKNTHRGCVILERHRRYLKYLTRAPSTMSAT